MPVRDFNFRPNPGRAVYVIGDFDDSLLAKVIPEINRLRFERTDPITVFINSVGGYIRSLEVLAGCLWDEDLELHQCRIITVATGDAASSAATLLSLGDYTLAHPRSDIHFHGARLREREITTETASQCASALASKNLEIAFRLANSMIRKICHRFSIVCDDFKKIRDDNPKDSLTDLDCFVRSIYFRVGTRAGEVLNAAYEKTKSAIALSNMVLPKVKFKQGDSGLTQDVSVFRGILKHEVSKLRQRNWRLDEEGCSQIVMDYLLLRDYELGKHRGSLGFVANMAGIPFLRPDEFKEFMKRHHESEKDALAWRLQVIMPRITPFWYFTVRLCQQLQEGENRLSPNDAYWLGAVDEVIGTDLAGYRAVMESELTEQGAA